MKGLQISIKDYKVNNSFEMAESIVRLILYSKNIKLSKSENHTLIHFVLDGYNEVTREKLIRNKLLKTKNCVSNAVSSLRKMGIIIKTDMGDDLHSDFKINLKDIDAIQFQMLIKK